MKQKNKLYLLFFIGFSLFVYANSFSSKTLILDDFKVIINNIFITSFKYLPFYLKGRITSDPSTSVLFRPLWMLTYNLNYLITGYNLWSYRALNIINHGLNGLLLYILFTCLFGEERKRLAFFLALLFIAHPVNTEPVNYLSSRADLLLFTFFVCVVLYFLKWINNGNKEHLLLSFFFTFLAYLTKEHAVVMPAVVFLLLIRYNKLRKHFLIFITHILIALVAIFYYWLIHRGILHVYLPSDLVSNFLLQLKVGFLYLKLFFYPRSLSLIHKVTALKVWEFISLSVVLMGIFVSWLRFRYSNFLLGIILFWLLLIPKSFVNLEPFSAMERHFYLPQVGVWLSLFALLNKFNARKVTLFLFPALLLCVSMTVSRNKVWRSEETVWMDAWNKNPGDWRVEHSLGLIYLRRGETEQAKRFLYSSLENCRHSGFLPYIVVGIIETYRREGKEEKAEQILQQLCKVYPKSYQLRDSLGQVYLQEGKLQQAEKCFIESLQINPFNSSTLYNLGLLYYKKGDLEKAQEYFQKCIKIRPLFDLPYLQLGRIYEEKEEYNQAICNYKQAIKCNPSQVEACFSLGTLYAKMENPKAEFYLKKVLKMKPKMAEAWYNLGLFYLQNGDKNQAKIYIKNAEELGYSIPEIIRQILGK